MRFCLSGLMVVMLWHSVPANAEVVRLTTHNLVPYSYYNEKGDFTGVAYEVLLCAFSQMDYQIDLSVVPWQRAQNMVISGQADGFFAGSQKDERDEYAVLTAPIADQNWAWFWRADTEIDEALLFSTDVYRRSSFFGANMQSWLESSDYLTSPAKPSTTEQLAEMVKYGRIDVGLANQAVLEYYLESTNQRDLFKIRVAQEKPLGLYLSKPWIAAHPEFLSTFNQIVQGCRE